MTRLIKRHAEGREACVMVIDHDIHLVDITSERILVFEGEPGVRGTAAGQFGMREGLNRILANLGVTFPRDSDGSAADRPARVVPRPRAEGQRGILFPYGR